MSYISIGIEYNFFKKKTAYYSNKILINLKIEN